MEQIWLIWDLAALLILAGCIFFAARAGFVRTLISFFAYVAAAVAANILSGPAAVWIYDTFLGDFIKGILTGSLRETIAKDGGAAQFAENAPVWLRGAFDLVPEEMLNSMDLSQNAARAVDLFVDSSLRGGIIWLLSGIVFFFAFLILVVLVKQIAKLFTFVDRIPLIGTVNTALGGVLGAVEAVIILCVAAILAHAVVMLSGDMLPFVNSAVFEQSFLMRFFYRLTAF